ncbi:hypothetical protein F4561_004278 [Lipingzhangella halophila]|uniref:Lantibiotic dehydratase N-terminal domain-containing protein n=1 Tax=Lipingzhangella halophila TaxID=1783352 RepID=A0A7W7RKX6_9ACTN|nr:lantibiotic dehydratase [Lipingzhangella halophila]MBB4933458.1 hypothetical protein [Lipingzhangella halophila]
MAGTTPARAEPPRFRVAETLAARICGLDMSVLTRLTCPKTLSAVHTCLDREAALATEAAAISDDLFPVIGALSDNPLKPRLVGLRRAVYQGRDPGPGEWNTETADYLPGPLRERVTAWLAKSREQREALAELPTLLDAESDDKRAELRGIIADAAFQRALSQASPDLFEVVRRWLTDPHYQPRRSSLVRLVKYVVRAATKTSPFSTFTASGRAEWTTGPAPATLLAATGPARCVPELRGGVVDQLRRALVAVPALRAALPVRVNPSLTEQDGTLCFLRPGADEPIVSVPDTGEVRAVLAAAGEAEGPGRTAAELTTQIAAVRSETAAADVARFVDRMLDIGLLEAYVPVPDQSASPFAGLARWLAANAPEYTAVGEHVSVIDSALAAPAAAAEVDGQRARKEALATATRALAGELAAANEQEPAVPEETLASKTFLHDNAVFTAPVAECSRARWSPALADLDLVRRWLAAIHDPALPLRLVLGDLVAERFGPGAQLPFLELHRAVQTELDQPAGFGAELRAAMDSAYFLAPGALDDATLPRLRRLGELREQSRAVLREADGSARSAEAVRAAAAEQIATLPSWVTPPASLACYVQQLPADGDAAVVCNAVMTGYGRGRARLHHLIHLAGGPASEPDVPSGGVPDVLAELTGSFGSALNRRMPAVSHELDYPGCVPERPREQRVALGELVVGHESDTGLLRASATTPDRPVRPLHIGGTADSLLPPAARLLSHAFEGSFLLAPVAPSLAPRDAAFPPEDVVHQPRVQLGNVVLQRAFWLVPAHAVPQRSPSESRAMFLYRMVRWLRERDIPESCFVRSMGPAPQAGVDTEAAQGNWRFRKSRKPVFVDFAALFALDVLEQGIAEGETVAVKFEEALPHPGDAAENGAGERRVTEFVVEVAHHERDI